MKKLLIILVLIPWSLFSQELNYGTVEVFGKSTRSISPDEIELSIIFMETENVKKENELEIKEKKLTNLISSYKIPSEDLVVNKITASRSGYYYKSSSNKVRLTKSYQLRIENVGIVDELIIKLFEIGADRVAISDLISEKMEQVKTEAIKEALDDATNKARLMTQHTGADLGTVISIKELVPSIQKPMDLDDYEFPNYQAAGWSLTGFPNQSTSNEIGVGKIEIQYHVRVVFQMLN